MAGHYSLLFHVVLRLLVVFGSPVTCFGKEIPLFGLDHRLSQGGQVNYGDPKTSESFQSDVLHDGQEQLTGGRNDDKGPIFIGFLEWVTLGQEHTKIKAKIDTGAKTSSIGIDKLEWFEQDGVPWIRFWFTPSIGDKAMMERRLVRFVRIRRAGCTTDIRPVVMLQICLGNHAEIAEFNLTVRKGMGYPMLIGRQFLGKFFAIKPSETFLTFPNCKP